MAASNLRNIYNFRQLTDRIATAGQPTEEELAAVAQAGFETVINLALLDADYSLPDERALVESLGMAFVHIPVIWEYPEDENLDAFLQAMEQGRERRLFIHCAANMRVSVFMALYRIITLGWPAQDAMKDVHAIWQPNEIWSRFIQAQLARKSGGG